MNYLAFIFSSQLIFLLVFTYYFLTIKKQLYTLNIIRHYGRFFGNSSLNKLYVLEYISNLKTDEV